MSFMSSDLKSLSHEGSFLSHNQSFEIGMDFGKSKSKLVELASPL